MSILKKICRHICCCVHLCVHLRVSSPVPYTNEWKNIDIRIEYPLLHSQFSHASSLAVFRLSTILIMFLEWTVHLQCSVWMRENSRADEHIAHSYTAQRKNTVWRNRLCRCLLKSKICDRRYVHGTLNSIHRVFYSIGERLNAFYCIFWWNGFRQLSTIATVNCARRRKIARFSFDSFWMLIYSLITIWNCRSELSKSWWLKFKKNRFWRKLKKKFCFKA